MFIFFVEIKNSRLKSSDDWIIANIQQNGFYRVNYDENNWRALSRQLKTRHQVMKTTHQSLIV